MEIPEYFTELSIRMSEALDDSGAGKDIVMERRVKYLQRERTETIASSIYFNGDAEEHFHFGSQSEGTTTPGLQSDIDLLISKRYANVIRLWGDWKAGIMNLLMLNDDITPPQQYLLQVIRTDTPEPMTSMCIEWCVRKDSDLVLFSAEKAKQHIEHCQKHLGEAIKNGPSVSFTPNIDIVRAFPVRKPLPEIQHWIDRCNGKHWPPAQLLDAARVASCFLVPAGHEDSDHKREEWRLSPNLIERMLMFSFNMTQIKCCILLKIIKKSLFAYIVGDSFTSFHCKTIMFYTIERTHASLWCEHNLMFLLRLCLHVLRKWLRVGRQPHYIIEGVNLFDGKLSKVQQRRLSVYINSMIKNNLQDVFNIRVDNIRCRLQACSLRRIGEAGELGRLRLRNSISLLLKFENMQRCYQLFYISIYAMSRSNTTFEQGIKYALCNLFLISSNVRWKNVDIELIEHMYALHNSMQASHSLQLRHVIDTEIISRFRYFFNTDVASSRLKLASMLYCLGHIQAAIRVLEDVQRRYHSKVKAVCGCTGITVDRDFQVFANMISGNCHNGFGEPPFVFCVRFVRQELYCIPFILLFEMNRHITEEEAVQRNHTDKHWMDCAEVDARPFLHYLQYITYGGLGARDKQLHALEVLVSYLCDISNSINVYHGETAVNLLGHCYEMEGDYERALYWYELSLRIRSTNNAANWHIRRVLRIISG